MPELRRLRYFVAVATERNFTRAAERLHVAQPALSRQVRLLERELGVELLRRTTHEVALTDAGRFLLDRAPAVLGATDELWRGVRAFAAGERGGVVVGYGASAGYETAPRLLEAIAERLPALEVDARVMATAAILDAVGDGTLDAGLVRCPPARDGIEARVVRRERQGVLLRRDHALAAAATVALADLGDAPVLLHPRAANPGHYDAVLDLCRAAGVEPRVLERSAALDLAQTPVVEGRAVAIVGESSRTVLPPELTWVALTPPAALDVALVARARDRSPALERVLATAADAAVALGWLDGDADAL
jgi:DNA-binding transcriptional LysR family regulator